MEILRILMIIFFLTTLAFICQCHRGGVKVSVDSIVQQWVVENNRISDSFEIRQDNDTLELKFFEVSKVGSPVIEELSSNDIVSLVLQNGFDVQNTIVYFDLPLSIATYGKEEKKVLTSYSYSADQLEQIKMSYENEVLSKISRYIAFEFENRDEHELLQTGNLSKEVFSWYPLDTVPLLKAIYNYPLMASTLSDSQKTFYLNTFAATYKVAEIAEINCLRKFKSILEIIGDVPFDKSFDQIDSIGRSSVFSIRE